MRSFSSLYFLFRLVIYFSTLLSYLVRGFFHTNDWLIFGSLFSILSLFTAFAKPYNKPYMNYFDAILHWHVAISCFILSTGPPLLIITRLLLWTPITLLFLIFLSTSFKKLKFAILKILKKSLSKLNWLSRYFKSTPLTIEPNYNQQVYVCDPKADKPLIQPTSSVITYGAINDNAV